jgi:hypothetical protein
MNTGERIEMQERAIRILSMALASEPEQQALIIRVAKLQAIEDMNTARRNKVYTVKRNDPEEN